MIEGAERGAVVRGDGHVQSVAGAQAEYVLVGEAGGGAELLGADRECCEALGGEAGEHRQGGGAVGQAEMAGAKLNGQG